MKKSLFSLMALATIVAGCAKSEVIDAPNIDTPISFEAYSGRTPISKAQSIDGETAEDRQTALSEIGLGFVVYAYNTVASTAQDGSTTYTPDWSSLYFNETLSYNGGWQFNLKEGNDTPNVYYWPSDGNDLAFVAYSNNGAVYVDPTSSTTAPSLTISVSDEVADQKDIMVAKHVQTRTKESDAVKLNFSHVLSRIYFELSSDRSITVESVAVNGNFYSSGSVALDAETPSVTVSDDSDVESYEFLINDFTLTTATGTEATAIIDNTTDATAEETNDYYMMLIPATPSTVVVRYYFEEDRENKYIATATLNEDLDAENKFTFEAGKSYKFALSLKSDAISFEADVDAWAGDTEIGSPSDSDTYEFVTERYTEENN